MWRLQLGMGGREPARAHGRLRARTPARPHARMPARPHAHTPAHDHAHAHPQAILAVIPTIQVAYIYIYILFILL